MQMTNQGTPTSTPLELNWRMIRRWIARRPATTQLLSSAEALTMPGVQVIVLNANMRCNDCRERVSKLLSKMDILLDYVVDVTHKKVTVRGIVDPKKKTKRLKRVKRLLNQKRELGNIQFERLSKHKDLEKPKRNKRNAFPHNLINGGCCFR